MSTFAPMEILWVLYSYSTKFFATGMMLSYFNFRTTEYHYGPFNFNNPLTDYRNEKYRPKSDNEAVQTIYNLGWANVDINDIITYVEGLDIASLNPSEL
jgi:hypothetical protein